jgi:inward rectifier potassium channel
VTFTGIDDSLAAAVHTRASYSHTDLRYDERFVDILIDDPDGRRYLDFTHFHDTRPVEARSS